MAKQDRDIQDVTSAQQAEEPLPCQQERLAAMEQMAIGIAHNFNHLLTTIINHAELLRRRQDTSPSADWGLESIIREGWRAAHLTRQILDFSGTSIIEKRPLDLLPILQETVQRLKYATAHNITVKLDFAPDCDEFTIQADPEQIKQALTNLAANATEAMPNGGCLQFKLGPFNRQHNQPLHQPIITEEWLVLSVSDTGNGVPPEFQSRVFEPFFSTKDTDQSPGLGLAQTYGIMKQHGGFLKLSSRKKNGTQVDLYFPPHRETIL